MGPSAPKNSRMKPSKWIPNRIIMSAFLEISQLTKIYDTPQGPAIIVQDFDLKIDKGEFVCIIGHSGCGKTTVLSDAAIG